MNERLQDERCWRTNRPLVGRGRHHAPGATPSVLHVSCLRRPQAPDHGIEATYTLAEVQVGSAGCTDTVNGVRIGDLVLRELHRAAAEAGRPGIAIPSVDLAAVARATGDRDVAADAIRRLAASKRAVRVRRDLLVLPDATGLIRVEIDDLVDAVASTPYLITAGAALEHAGLTDQHFFGLVVLVPSEITPLHYRGQHAAFYKTDPTNIWGWHDQPGPRYARPERAIVDGVNHPRYGLSLTQVIGALAQARARDDNFLDRLFEVVERYGAGTRGHSSRAAARRVGLLIERLYGPDAAAPYRDLIGPNRAPTLLRPGGALSGSLDRRWRVVVNAELPSEPTG